MPCACAVGVAVWRVRRVSVEYTATTSVSARVSAIACARARPAAVSSGSSEPSGTFSAWRTITKSREWSAPGQLAQPASEASDNAIAARVMERTWGIG